MSIYKMKSAEAVVDNVRDLNTRMPDIDKLAATQNGLLTVFKNAEKQRQSDLAAINANFKAIDKRLSSASSSPVASKLPAVSQVAKSTAAGAMYYGPRTALFMVVTTISVAIAAIFYSGQFEQPEVATTAWMAIYACAGAFVPSAALTWITRRK